MSPNLENPFDKLPDEMLVQIFSHLPRRERLACSMVSSRWQQSLDAPTLWKFMTVRLDMDLMEPSTMLLTRQYHRHIKHLKLTWSKPQIPARWMPHKFQEISKRACRYVIIMKESLIQLQSINLNDWYDISRFKKLVYLLSQFLRMQTKLQSISFQNAHLNKNDFLKLLISCRSCEHTVKYINTHHSYFHFDDTLLSVQLITCFETFESLVTLTLDYSTFCREVVLSLINTKNESLKFLEVHVRDEEMNKTIKDEYWRTLKEKFPTLKVAFHFNYINCLSRLNFVLSKDIPLTAIHLCFGETPTSKCYKEVLTLITKYYQHSLEAIRLDIINDEVMKSLFRILNRCPNLKNMEFCGLLENVNTFHAICDQQNQKRNSSFTYCAWTQENFIQINEVHCVEYKYLQFCIKKKMQPLSIKN